MVLQFNPTYRLHRWSRVAAPALLFALASLTHAEIVAIPASHLGEGKTLRAQYFAPDAKSDAPRAAVILLHGCGGVGAKGELNARHTMWKDWYVARGFVVLFPESFSSRGYEQICTQKFGDRSIKQADRVNDVRAAKRWLEARKEVDPKKLVLMGWSHGGGTTLATITTERAGGEISGASGSPTKTLVTASGASPSTTAADTPLNEPTKSTLPPGPSETNFVAAISFYPGCTSYAKSARIPKLSAPLTLLIGEADDWTPAEPCKAFVKRLQENKQAATITTFPGAFHDFDNPRGKLRVRKDVPNGVNGAEKGVTVGPDPEAREAVKKQIDALLRDAKLLAAF